MVFTSLVSHNHDIWTMTVDVPNTDIDDVVFCALLILLALDDDDDENIRSV